MSGWRNLMGTEDGHLQMPIMYDQHLRTTKTCPPPPQVVFVQLPPSSETGVSETLCIEVGTTIKYHSPSAGLCAGVVAVIAASGDKLFTWRFAHQRHLPNAELYNKEVSTGAGKLPNSTHGLDRKVVSSFPGAR